MTCGNEPVFFFLHEKWNGSHEKNQYFRDFAREKKRLLWTIRKLKNKKVGMKSIFYPLTFCPKYTREIKISIHEKKAKKAPEKKKSTREKTDIFWVESNLFKS